MNPIAFPAALCTDGHMLWKGFLQVCHIHIHRIVSTHTVSRVDLICMWLIFVALVISSVNGHDRKAVLKAYSLNCMLLGNVWFLVVFVGRFASG